MSTGKSGWVLKEGEKVTNWKKRYFSIEMPDGKISYYTKDNKLSNPKFEFYVKEIETPDKWQKDFLKKQIAKPWIKVGSCEIIKDSTAFYWNEKMHAILKSEANAK